MVFWVNNFFFSAEASNKHCSFTIEIFRINKLHTYIHRINYYSMCECFMLFLFLIIQVKILTTMYTCTLFYSTSQSSSTQQHISMITFLKFNNINY